MSTSSSADALAALRPDLFAGRQALVTGGTSGIGLAVAQAFARLGAAATATGATEAEVAAARATEPKVAFAPLDVRDGAAVAAAVAALPRLDVLVNCAGVICRGAELDPETFAEVVDINLTGSMRTSAAARPRRPRSRPGSPSSPRRWRASSPAPSSSSTAAISSPEPGPGGPGGGRESAGLARGARYSRGLPPVANQRAGDRNPQGEEEP